jgi:hypothetical protein
MILSFSKVNSRIFNRTKNTVVNESSRKCVGREVIWGVIYVGIQ